VYYTLLNWYRVLALLPGFSFNREFMERMMGVRERLEQPPAPRAATRAQDLLRLVVMVARMLAASARLRNDVPAFHARVERVLRPLAGEDLSRRPPDGLLRLYETLEAELLRHWRAPLVNDFFAMVWFGVLGKLCVRWLPGESPAFCNDLLCGEGGIVSTEPSRRVMAIARDVLADPAAAKLFDDEPDDGALWERLHAPGAPGQVRAALDHYVARFGDRCMEELKLETVTIGEDPRFLIQTLRAYMAQRLTDPDAALARERSTRAQAEATVRRTLRGPRRWVFMAVLKRARERVRDRENLRFERTRVFGVVRRLFVALGGHMTAAGALDAARDIFWLTRDEAFGWVEGTSVTRDLRALTALRRAEFEAFAREPAPPDRFETTGALADVPVVSAQVGAGSSATELSGTGCCPGVVRARVRIVRDPRAASDLAGHILVAERTDPGWTLLFPAARGLLVQRGSLLSHSAIVAREMGLPCIVGISALLDTLRDGELVEMDGARGVVRRHEPTA
jgi:pyruvate,water dikinase